MNIKQLLLSTLIGVLAISNANALFDFDLSKTPSRGECLGAIAVAGAIYAFNKATTNDQWRNPVEKEDKIIVSQRYFDTTDAIDKKAKKDAGIPILVMDREGHLEVRCPSGIRLKTTNTSDCEEYDKLYASLKEKHAPKKSTESDQSDTQ